MYTLITGGSGFLGSTIINKLIQSDHKIFNLSRTSNREVFRNLEISIADNFELPDYYFNNIIHVAGFAHKDLKNEFDKNEMFKVNINGTLNLINALNKLTKLPLNFVYISSVSVYGLISGDNISEKFNCKPIDPYGFSKFKSEEILIQWCKKNNIVLTILRLPLIVGSNAPGNIRNMINGIKKGYYFNINRGIAKKSVVLLEDVADLIPNIFEIGGIYNLTDGYHPTISELSKIISDQLGKKKPKSIPYFIAKLLAIFGDLIGPKFPINSNKLNKITSSLTFDDTSARINLNWNPRNVIDVFII